MPSPACFSSLWLLLLDSAFDPQPPASRLPGGWLRTGDGGSFDADGFLYLHDRLKDMIVSGGENVYPAEVESVMTGHPAVAEVAVIGVPSAEWGESPMPSSSCAPARRHPRTT